MGDLVKQMRDHVTSRGGPTLKNGAWSMLLEAADRIEELEALCANLNIQVQVWAQEARTQKSTVHKCYQAATGSTGEPGDWNGARPVVERIKELEAENAKLREALTPSADTKAAYMSEVVLETISDDDEDGLPVAVTRYVPWTAIKDTMKLIRARASESGEDDRQAP